MWRSEGAGRPAFPLLKLRSKTALHSNRIYSWHASRRVLWWDGKPATTHGLIWFITFSLSFNIPWISFLHAVTFSASILESCIQRRINFLARYVSLYDTFTRSIYAVDLLWLCLDKSLPYIVSCFNNIIDRWVSIHKLGHQISLKGCLSITLLHCRASIQQGSLLNYFGQWRVTLWVNQKTKLRWSPVFISYS
jgi:hypothetical protein